MATKILQVLNPFVNLMTATDLTEEEKAKIRANIGALTASAHIENDILMVGIVTIQDNILIIK